MEPEQRRRSDRVSLLTPIRVAGSDPAGEAFSDEGRTLVVTLHGAAISVSRELAANQEITLRAYGSEKEAKARVVGQIERQAEGSVYGVKFVEPDVNLWNIRFPSPFASQNAVGKLLLVCEGCETRELVCLDELEAEVYAANECLSRACPVCATATLWKEALPELPPGPGAKPPASALRRRARNKRRHVRVKVKFKACIRHPETGEEVVTCENVSRGGIAFPSRTLYPEGALIDVAVPFSAGEGNIFAAAKIVRQSESEEDDVINYGAAYLTGPADAEPAPATGITPAPPPPSA